MFYIFLNHNKNFEYQSIIYTLYAIGLVILKGFLA